MPFDCGVWFLKREFWFLNRDGRVRFWINMTSLRSRLTSLVDPSIRKWTHRSLIIILVHGRSFGRFLWKNDNTVFNCVLSCVTSWWKQTKSSPRGQRKFGGARLLEYITMSTYFCCIQSIIISQHYTSFLETAIPRFLQVLKEGNGVCIKTNYLLCANWSAGEPQFVDCPAQVSYSSYKLFVFIAHVCSSN